MEKPKFEPVYFFLLQDYKKIMSDLKDGELWTDPCFPPKNKSIAPPENWND